MSKAFTREDDDAPERPRAPLASPLPPGARNLLTQAGAARLREELDRLEAGRASLMGADLDAVEQRIATLRMGLAGAEIVPPPPLPWEQVRFGATVTVRAESGDEERYRIVGVAEADPARDCVSWLSPIARALLQRRVGERVVFRFPSGEQRLEIRAVSYE